MLVAATVVTLQFLTSGPFLFFTLLLLALKGALFRGGVRGPPLPPGPRAWPLVGHLPLLRADCHLRLTRLAREYGPVYQLWLARKRAVVVSDYALVREALRRPAFSGRPDTELTKLIGGRGVINAEGAVWREQRAFLHSVLKDFGAKHANHQNSPLHHTIKREVGRFLEFLRSSAGRPVSARAPLARSVSNVIGSLLMSVTWEEPCGEFSRLHALIDEGFKLLTVGAYVNFMPLLKYLPFVHAPYTKIRANIRETTAYFARVAAHHKESLRPQDTPRDFVDAFYLQQKKNQHSSFSEAQLCQVMGDVLSAGLETVTSTLEWALLFLLLHPCVQRRLWEEVDREVGAGRDPEWADLSRLPYTHATLLEVQRRGNVIALGNTHATTQATTLGGYLIPAGTHVIPNLWAIHMDPELWEEPEAFRPERFLRDGKVVQPPFFMPFSVGRRMCVGDTLSKMEIFHFLTNIVQKFHLTPAPDAPDLQGLAHISLQPKSFKICATPR